MYDKGRAPGGSGAATRRRVTRALKTLLYGGIGASWIGAYHLRGTPLAQHAAVGPDVVVMLLGISGTGLCIAGLEWVRAISQRQWRNSRGRAFGGRHRTGTPVPDVTERVAACERKISEVFELMSAVCDELGVDTTPADETRPMLRLVKGGEAS